MPKNVLPPRIIQRGGKYYVAYHDGTRGSRVSLRTKDSEIAVTRFEGWLKEHRLQINGEPDPMIADCLDKWFEQWISGRMLSENRYPSIIGHLKKAFGGMRVSPVSYTHLRAHET